MSPDPRAIDFARYAEVLAHLRRFPAGDEAEVLARLGLRRRAWEAAAARWSAAREAELASGKTALTVTFGAVFTRTRQRLDAQRASLASLGPLPGPDELAPEPAPVPEPAPAPPVEAPVIQLISAQLAPPQPAAPSFLVRPPALHEAPPAPAPPIARPFEGTLPLGAVLPIARLPFQEGSAERAFASAVAHAEAVQGPADARRDPRSLGATVGVSSEAPSAVLPFATSAPAGVPELTLAQYASLRVELQLQPERAALILARYGVPADARPALDASWRARFDADPLLRMEFARAYAAYTAWLRGSPR
jgi:hypothetical protein